MTQPRLSRRGALALLVVSTVLLAALAAALVPWDWVPGGRLEPMRAEELFSAAHLAEAERYSRIQRWLGWISTFLSLGVLLLLGLTTLGGRLVRRVAGARRWWLAVPVGTLAVLLVVRLTTLPLSVASHAVDRSFSISDQGWAGWLLDVGRGLFVSWVGTGLLLLTVVGLARRLPRWWFAWAAAAAAGFVVAGSFLYPVLVEPLFNRFTSLPEGRFRAQVLELAEQEGVVVDDVLVADASRRTTRLNAYVSGLAGTRRVVVYDTLLDGASEEEALLVVAHELAHAKNHDVALGTALGAIGAVAGVALLALLLDSRVLRRRSGTAGARDPAVIALVLALGSVGGLVTAPLQNVASRAIEARADRGSLESTGADDAFVRMQQRLAERSLADPTPPGLSRLWRASHPTVLERAGLPASLERARR